MQNNIHTCVTKKINHRTKLHTLSPLNFPILSLTAMKADGFNDLISDVSNNNNDGEGNNFFLCVVLCGRGSDHHRHTVYPDSLSSLDK